MNFASRRAALFAVPVILAGVAIVLFVAVVGYLIDGIWMLVR